MGLAMAREQMARAKASTALVLDAPADVTTRERLGLAIVPKESPVDRVRSVIAAHPVPAEWRDRLAAIAPESLTQGWLAFGWLEKAERFVIYEMIPTALIPREKREQLAGTPYWKMPETLRVGRQQMVSAFQWEMYRKHQVWARPFWCLQGTDGGTPAKYSEMEEAMLRAAGLSTDVPEPGAFPFAPFDGLAEQQLRRRDRLWRAGGSLDRIKRSGSSAVMLAETAEAERAFREAFISWWEETMRPQTDFLTWFGKSDTRTAGVDAGVLRPATDEEVLIGHTLKDTFIETGTIPITRAEP